MRFCKSWTNRSYKDKQRNNKAQEKLVYGEADTVVSDLKRGGSYQFKAVYEPDDKDGQTYYETVTSEAATVTIKEDSSTGGGSSSGGSSGGGNTSGGNTVEGKHRPTETKPM